MSSYNHYAPDYAIVAAFQYDLLLYYTTIKYRLCLIFQFSEYL